MRSRSVLRLPPLAAAVVLAGLAGCGGAQPPSRTGGGDASAVTEGASASPSSPASADGTGAGTSTTDSDSGPSEPPASAPVSPNGEPSPAPTPAGTTPAEPTPSSRAPFEADTRPDSANPEGNGLTVTDVQVGRHEGHDRVVFTLGGQGAPGWRVEYVDSPTRQGSGEPFTPAGEAFLSVVLSGIGYPFDTGVQEYDGPTSIAGGAAEVVEEVQVQGVFEGQYDAAIGVSDRLPFRVFRLDGPPRVVVDVAHRG